MRSRTAQLILQSFYCAFALVGFIASVGFFDMVFRWDFYIYFTNTSNYLSGGIMLAELIQTARRRGDGYVSVAPRLKFIAVLSMLLTFLIFNFLIAGQPTRAPAENFKPACVLLHIVLPLLFVTDWILFYEHGRANWKLPLLSAVFPLVYLGFLYIHAAVLKFNSSIMNYTGEEPLIYPYFFLNPDRVGAAGIAKWTALLLLAFIALGFLVLLLDRLIGKRK